MCQLQVRRSAPQEMTEESEKKTVRTGGVVEQGDGIPAAADKQGMTSSTADSIQSSASNMMPQDLSFLAHAKWFNLHSVSELERRILPEFFTFLPGEVLVKLPSITCRRVITSSLSIRY